MDDRTGNALTVPAGLSAAALMLSSPDLRRWRGMTLGSVRWPGERERKYLPAGSTLTADERKRIAAKVAELKALAGFPGEHRAEKGAIVARLLMAYPLGGAATEESGAARAGAYLDALDDVPSWAIGEATRRWNRGEAGEGMNYSFAPAPAILRKLALRELEPITIAIADLEALAGAVTLDEAMSSKAEEPANALVPRLRRV
jgi:hypothetical protein